MAQLKPFHANIFHLYLTSLFLASTPVASKPSGLSLKLISPDSPNSPFYLGNISELERINHMIEASDARVMSYQSIQENPNGLQIPVYKYAGSYAVHLFVGTPRTKQTFIVDTGSGLTWTQCKPCDSCFDQSDPMFAFPDGSSSLRHFENIVFGCSTHSTNFDFGNTDHFSGILGLNTALESLVNQLRSITNRRFSYCLAFGRSPVMRSGVLRFGNDIPNISNLQRTPFVRQNISPNYYLNLLDISVGGRRMGFRSGTFAIQPKKLSAFVIDSGSTITYLNQGPYETVMNAFKNHFLQFVLERVYNLRTGTGIKLDLCYRLKNGFRQFIGMTFHFQRADMVVDPNGMYMSYPEGFFCVTIKSSSGLNLLGASQQKNLRMINITHGFSLVMLIYILRVLLCL